MSSTVIDLSEGDERGAPRRRLNDEGEGNAQNPIDLLDSDSEVLEDEDEDEDAPYHHPGDLEPSDDGFVDWDDDCHGDRYSNSIRREYPDEYVWDCCGASGTSKGCTKGEGPDIDEKYATSPEPELDEIENHHSGELEINSESHTWDDWDEGCHGPMDSKTNRSEYPDGFVWNCCEKEGTYASGCEGEDGEEESDDE
jgi:hypothetical protein